ncbi:MAG: MFS transporter [Paramuribaculum sp.]|nr:MFS transporter [Paramuribaculum sp.]
MDADIRRNLSQWQWVPSLYFAEGLPYAAVMTLSVVMYKCMGIGNDDVAFYTSWLYLPWVVKALWSPFVELLSTRRRWVVATQGGMAVAFALIAFWITAPVGSWFVLSLSAFWVLAFVSATHDIAADGFYMLALDERRQAWWVGLRSGFYRGALVFGQGALVYLAGAVEHRLGVEGSWRMVFLLLSAIFVLLALWHGFRLPRPTDDNRAPLRPVAEIMAEFVATFRYYFTKPGVWGAIAFIFLYRFPEAMLVKLITPFMLDAPEAGGLGLSTAQVGVTYGVIGVGGLLLGGILGGFAVARSGLRQWIMPMAVAMSLSCLTFLYLSMSELVALSVVNICVFIEQFGYGFGLTAFTLYLLYFSDGPSRTACYAICTGFMALGMMLPGMVAGWIQVRIGYTPFFTLAAVGCVTTIAIAEMARRRLKS